MKSGMAALTTQYRLLANYYKLVEQPGYLLKPPWPVRNIFA